MSSKCSLPQIYVWAVITLLACAVNAFPQASKPKKVLMITDMEGVDGIFDEDLQCVPWKSPRWEESRKLLTGEANAAVEGLYQGGATDVVVWDGHDSSQSLSVLDIHPRARLLAGARRPAGAGTLGLRRGASAIATGSRMDQETTRIGGA